MIIKAKNINKSYQIAGKPVTYVLKDLSVDISKGEFVSFVGPSGVGKSTLLHILGSIDTPDSGKVEYNMGEKSFSLSELTESELDILRNSSFGFVFQFHHLLPEFTALENIMMPSLIKGIKQFKAKQKALELMDLTGIADKSDNKPSELSGGEQQRVAIARALINKPAILFADEPTGNLDKENADMFLKLLQKVKKEFNLTVIVTTHSEYVSSVADRVLKLSDGIII